MQPPQPPTKKVFNHHPGNLDGNLKIPWVPRLMTIRRRRIFVGEDFVRCLKKHRFHLNFLLCSGVHPNRESWPACPYWFPELVCEAPRIPRQHLGIPHLAWCSFSSGSPMFITFVYSDLHTAISSSDCCLFVSPIEGFQIWTRRRLNDQMALLKPAWVVDAGDNDVDSAAFPSSQLSSLFNV